MLISTVGLEDIVDVITHCDNFFLSVVVIPLHTCVLGVHRYIKVPETAALQQEDERAWLYLTSRSRYSGLLHDSVPAYVCCILSHVIPGIQYSTIRLQLHYEIDDYTFHIDAE